MRMARRPTLEPPTLERSSQVSTPSIRPGGCPMPAVARRGDVFISLCAAWKFDFAYLAFVNCMSPSVVRCIGDRAFPLQDSSL